MTAWESSYRSSAGLDLTALELDLRQTGPVPAEVRGLVLQEVGVHADLDAANGGRLPRAVLPGGPDATVAEPVVDALVLEQDAGLAAGLEVDGTHVVLL